MELKEVVEKLDLVGIELQEMNGKLARLKDFDLHVMKICDSLDKLTEAVNRAGAQL